MINDNYGHPAGPWVAQVDYLGPAIPAPLFARMGGDEVLWAARNADLSQSQIVIQVGDSKWSGTAANSHMWQPVLAWRLDRC